MKNLLALLTSFQGDRWFVTGISGEAMTNPFKLDLSFVGSKTGTLFFDGKTAAASIKKKEVSAGSLELSVPACGGFVIKH